MIKNENQHLNALRMLGVAAVNKANSGHPGIVLGAAPIVYTLFTETMNFAPKNPQWFNRDRFILSAGHGSALLYAALHLAGFPFSLDDLKNFRQLNSVTPGHPERNTLQGVEVTTGPLGQGIAMGVGMALAESFLASKFNKPDFPLIDHFTFVLCGDGDLQEGISQEAISFAGKQKLKKLVVIHDSNDVQLDDKVSETTIENQRARFEAAGWETFIIKDGEDLESLKHILEQAKKNKKPTYIEVKTIIGLGASKQGTSTVHGTPLGEDFVTVKKYFHWEKPDFEIPQETYDYYQKKIQEKGAINHQKWEQLYKKYLLKYPQEGLQIQKAWKQDWAIPSPEFEILNHPQKEATRNSSGKIFEHLMQQNPTMIGGSADLSSSTKIKGADGNFSPENRQGRNIMYGVREFAMGAITNGLAAHGGILPVASGFLVFSDYMKAAVRLAALMELQNLFIFTHDSIAVGEDGPTHEPIEQLAMLRTIPNHNVFRPADFAETLAAYEYAIQDKNRPSSIIVSRQDLKLQNNKSVKNEVAKGAYILSDLPHPEVTLIASGSEVQLAIEIQKALKAQNVSSRVVSMVAMNLFDSQSLDYQKEIIDPQTLRVSLEMGTTYGWGKYVGDQGLSFGIDRFGASGRGDQVIAAYGFTTENIIPQILKKLKERK